MYIPTMHILQQKVDLSFAQALPYPLMCTLSTQKLLIRSEHIALDTSDRVKEEYLVIISWCFFLISP